jgi:outer membrane protein assembly factor BamB
MLLLFGSSFGLAAIDPGVRARRWGAECDGDGSVADSIAVCEPKPDRLAAWSATSGQPIWRTELPEDVWTTPVVGGGTVLVRNSTHLYGLDLATGKLRYAMSLR